MTTENITNYPEFETARQQKVMEDRAHPVQPPDPKMENQLFDTDTSLLPKGMAEKIETIEVSTLKPGK